MFAKYSAAFVSIAITLVAAVATLTDVTAVTLVQLGILAVTAVTTYALPLVPGRWAGAAKTGLEVVGAALTAIVPFVLAGHITGPQIAIVILAVLKALGAELGVAVRTDTALVR